MTHSKKSETSAFQITEVLQAEGRGEQGVGYKNKVQRGRVVLQSTFTSFSVKGKIKFGP